MITIEVNCNSNEVKILDNGKFIILYKVYHPKEMINMFFEIFNRIAGNGHPIGVKLTKIDEDSLTTLEEWW